jgi:sec-independent protein translocase protein TatC
MALDQVDVDKLDGNEGDEMSFFDHIAALRGHIVRSFLVLFAVLIVVFCYNDFIFSDILQGPTKADFITFRFLCQQNILCFTMPEVKFKTLTLGEAFGTAMSASFWIALAISFPYIVWEIWRFVKPGLHEKEQEGASFLLLIIGVLFAVGLLFGYYVVAPLAISFLLNFTIPGVTNSEPSISSYIDNLIAFTIPLGFVFELPVIMYFLGRIGIVSAKLLRNSRRYAALILMIIAAVITPSPDAWSMALVFVPLYGLFEASIWVVAKVDAKREKENEAFMKS